MIPSSDRALSAGTTRGFKRPCGTASPLSQDESAPLLERNVNSAPRSMAQLDCDGIALDEMRRAGRG